MRFPHLLSALLFLLLAAASAAAVPGQDPGAAWRLETERGPVTVRETDSRGFAALPVSALVSLGAQVAYRGDDVVVRLGGRELRFRPGAAAFTADGAARTLASPVYEEDGVVYLPAQFFREHLGEAAGALLSVDGARRVIRVAAGAPAAAVEAGAPPRRGTVAALAGETVVGRVEEVYRPAPARTPPAPAPSEAEEDAEEEEEGDPASAGDALGTMVAAASEQDGPPRKRLVVVDAGHGGRDPGARGPGGVREKDVALSVARRLAALLREDPSLEVRMTRDRDTLIALRDRTRMANAWKDEGQPALFISIHCNANPSRGEKGFETYFLSEARTADARRVEQFENSVVQFEERTSSNDPLSFILTDLRQNQYLRESSDWAQMIQDALEDVHPGPDRGVKQADFAVLRGAFMPAVLVEIGFVSNPREEQVLASRTQQQAIAEQLARSVRGFLDRSSPAPRRRQAAEN